MPNQPYSPAPQVGGRNGQGEAADYLSGPPNAASEPYASHNQTDQYANASGTSGTQDEPLGGGDGERGLVSNLVMGKLAGNKMNHGVSFGMGDGDGPCAP